MPRYRLWGLTDLRLARTASVCVGRIVRVQRANGGLVQCTIIEAQFVQGPGKADESRHLGAQRRLSRLQRRGQVLLQLRRRGLLHGDHPRTAGQACDGQPSAARLQPRQADLECPGPQHGGPKGGDGRLVEAVFRGTGCGRHRLDRPDIQPGRRRYDRLSLLPGRPHLPAHASFGVIEPWSNTKALTISA